MDRSFPAFAVACGEEASDPVISHEGRDHRFDQLAASGHLEHQAADFAAVAALGITTWRYGVPWRTVERPDGTYDWSGWDRALGLCEEHGLRPVVDLCHSGLPDHLGGFCDSRWVDAFRRYVDAFLVRYSAPVLFTPVNEPLIVALHSARLGTWNDRRRSPEDFGLALANVVLADLEAISRIHADRDGWWIGAEAFTIPVAAATEHEERAAKMRAASQLVWDLRFGVAPPDGADAVLAAVPDGVLGAIDALATTDRCIAGHDVYPVSVVPIGRALEDLTIQERAVAYETEARAWHARYGVDFWVAETSNLGLPVSQQEAWLEALVGRLDAMAADGLGVRGICWYSRGDQVDAETAMAAPLGVVSEVGLYDLDRRPRAVAAAYARLAADRA